MLEQEPACSFIGFDSERIQRLSNGRMCSDKRVSILQSLCEIFDTYTRIEEFSPSLQNALFNRHKEDDLIQGIVSGALRLYRFV